MLLPLVLLLVKSDTLAMNSMAVSLKDLIKTFLRHQAGVEVGRYRHTYMARRQRLLMHHDIDLVIDVGANDGRYCRELRRSGYVGRLLSFEPANAAFASLKHVADLDPNWTVVQSAVGAESGEVVLNLAEDPIFSSVVQAPTAHAMAAAPNSRFVDAELVPVDALDCLMRQHEGSSTALKVDVQGFERQVLAGAEETVRAAALVEIEMSPSAIYGDDQMLMPEMLEFFMSRGLTLVLVENLWPNHQTGAAFQFNGLFSR